MWTPKNEKKSLPAMLQHRVQNIDFYSKLISNNIFIMVRGYKMNDIQLIFITCILPNSLFSYFDIIQNHISIAAND